ncbi:hypothetical protein B0H17DRAFT_1195106 [Mycena rosella]|uniref:Uncharacterized protein n=1 Tax=Mycena rosella TaxID=1033263 RepID=A0AAD7GQP8_MYCRO|nr:hypothetical protein B0H17DRAFT_1195106 [Mycena rosella]
MYEVPALPTKCTSHKCKSPTCHPLARRCFVPGTAHPSAVPARVETLRSTPSALAGLTWVALAPAEKGVQGTIKPKPCTDAEEPSPQMHHRQRVVPPRGPRVHRGAARPGAHGHMGTALDAEIQGSDEGAHTV